MTLTTEQLAILDFHALAGDRVAYYEALASFGDVYGELALGVVLNDSTSGAFASAFFDAFTEGR